MGFLASLALCCDSQDRDLPVTQSRGLPAKREEWLPGVHHPPPIPTVNKYRAEGCRGGARDAGQGGVGSVGICSVTRGQNVSVLCIRSVSRPAPC